MERLHALDEYIILKTGLLNGTKIQANAKRYSVHLVSESVAHQKMKLTLQSRKEENSIEQDALTAISLRYSWDC